MLDFGYYNMDCMDGMKEFPDKYFDLAIVDPPYGIHVRDNMGRRRRQNSETIKQNHMYWDRQPPPEYFTELFRVAKHSIIWGGNYFALPPAKCFVIWDKPSISEKMNFAMCEYAWTDFTTTARVYRKYARDKEKLQTAQKPVDLYIWLLNIFAKEGDIILDTHVGGASSLIACRRTGHQYVGFELDRENYERSKARLEKEQDSVTP